MINEFGIKVLFVVVIVGGTLLAILQRVSDNIEKKNKVEQEKILKELKKEEQEKESQREETLATYLKVPVKHLIVSENKEKRKFYEAKTNGKTFLVKFNNDYTDIDKIVETSPSINEVLKNDD